MDDLAIVAGMALGAVCWWWLVRCMRINGRPWWLRHLAGMTLVIPAMAGFLFVVGGLLGVSFEDGETLGAADALGGLLVALPMLIPLAFSWRASRRAPVTPAPTRTAPAQEVATEPEPKPKPKPAQGRERLCFVYEDAKGNVSTREVTSWNDDGAYIEGYCHTSEDVRTFRRDRIASFLEGEHLLRPMAPKLEQGGKSGGAMEILFTGFPADERASLEEDAESYGLAVRKTVTKNLDFVCAGPRAGSTKLAKAREQGCVILGEDDFWSLVEDGVMPE